jgi:5'-nucleotidase (lipoprotein e(P4) family)
MVTAGCGQSNRGNHQEHLLQAALWYQQSAEMKALYYQAYNWAFREMEIRLEESYEKPLAVVLDIDETVLDNSPQTARQIMDGEAFNDQIWDEWCNLQEASALPGALEFTRKADSLGVEVFYISNRKSHLMEVTLSNLEALGFPHADTSHLLLKTDTSVKDARRSKVRKSHEILLLIGDNLGDFSGIFDERGEGGAIHAVRRHREKFGSSFIVLPNPMYGSWEKPYRMGSPEETLSGKLEALRPYEHP